MLYNKENGNKKWKEAEELELHQIDQYISFNDLGKGAIPPSRHKNHSPYSLQYQT